MDKEKKEKLEARRREEDAIFNKMLVWFLGAVIFEMMVIILKRFYVNFNNASESAIQVALGIHKALGGLRFVAPVIMVGALAWTVIRAKKQKALRLPVIVAMVGAALTMTAFLGYHYSGLGISLLGAVGPVVAVLAVVFFLYQREFFYSAILTGMGIVALWIYRKAYDSIPEVIHLGFALVIAVAIAAVVLALKISANKGKLGKHTVLESNASYLTVYLSAALTVLALAAALILGATVAYYAIFLLVAWAFCMVIYYTLRLM